MNRNIAWKCCSGYCYKYSMSNNQKPVRVSLMYYEKHRWMPKINELVYYRKTVKGKKLIVQIVCIHKDDIVPYFTIKILNNGHVKNTEITYLIPLKQIFCF